MNLGNYDGGIINDTEVILIINKLDLYIENEERIVQNIKSSLSSLQSYYSGDNDSVVNSKIDNLIIALDTMLDNRNRYVESLRLTVEGYKTHDQDSAVKYNGIN